MQDLTNTFVHVKAKVDTAEDQLQDYKSRRAAFRVIHAWLLAPDAQRLRSEKREHTRSREFHGPKSRPPWRAIWLDPTCEILADLSTPHG
jgi:hypothetical protein